MFLATNPQVAHMMKQIAEASEAIEIAKAELEETRGKHYTGEWATINRLRNRKKARYALFTIRQNEQLIEALNKKIEKMFEEEGTECNSWDKTEEELDAAILAMLLA